MNIDKKAGHIDPKVALSQAEHDLLRSLHLTVHIYNIRLALLRTETVTSGLLYIIFQRLAIFK